MVILDNTHREGCLFVGAVNIACFNASFYLPGIWGIWTRRENWLCMVRNKVSYRAMQQTVHYIHRIQEKLSYIID
jgi:hypothetical protein